MNTNFSLGNKISYLLVALVVVLVTTILATILGFFILSANILHKSDPMNSLWQFSLIGVAIGLNIIDPAFKKYAWTYKLGKALTYLGGITLFLGSFFLFTGYLFPEALIAIAIVLAVMVILVAIVAILDKYIPHLDEKIDKMTFFLSNLNIWIGKTFNIVIAWAFALTGILTIIIAHNHQEDLFNLTIMRILALIMLLMSLGVGYRFWYWLIDKALRLIPGYKP